MSLNRYTPRGFTAFRHLPVPKMRKCKQLMSVAIASPRYMLPRNPKYYNVNQLYVPSDSRKRATPCPILLKGAWK